MLPPHNHRFRSIVNNIKVYGNHNFSQGDGWDLSVSAIKQNGKADV